MIIYGSWNRLRECVHGKLYDYGYGYEHDYGHGYGYGSITAHSTCNRPGHLDIRIHITVYLTRLVLSVYRSTVGNVYLA
jgi:hypothetical protein